MAIDEAWLQNLVSNRQEESEQLDFKLTLPGRDDRAKIEFLKDVVGMANASGGQLVFGVGEEEGVASQIADVGPESADNAILRLGQSLEASVEPRIAGTVFQQIPLTTGGYVLVLTVSRSFTGPHRVVYGNKNAFYVRAQRHVSEFSYSQLRAAFTFRARAADRIQAFRAERLAMVKSDNGARSLLPGCRYVLHVMPLTSFLSDAPGIDSKILREKVEIMMPGNSTYRNLDGAVSTLQSNTPGDARYAQLFRSGCVELAGYAGSYGSEIIPNLAVAETIRDRLRAFADVLGSAGISGPVAIALSLLSTRGYSFPVAGWGAGYEMRSADRDDLVLPEIWQESLADVAENVDLVARPMLDILWQCFDQERCEHYYGEDKWRPRQY